MACRSEFVSMFDALDYGKALTEIFHSHEKSSASVVIPGYSQSIVLRAVPTSGKRAFRSGRMRRANQSFHSFLCGSFPAQSQANLGGH